jgi:hypothetical protein
VLLVSGEKCAVFQIIVPYWECFILAFKIHYCL